MINPWVPVKKQIVRGVGIRCFAATTFGAIYCARTIRALREEYERQGHGDMDRAKVQDVFIVSAKEPKKAATK